MEYAQGTKLKEIATFHLGIKKDKNGVVLVRYLLNGMKMHIVLAVIIN
jgi:hypothetical protein